MAKVVGPGAVQDQPTDIKPQLEGASEYEYVTILNPLSDDFAIRVAQDVPVNMPIDVRGKTGLIQEGNDIVKTYGLDLKNPDFQARKHITNDTIIKAGQTINLKGNEAQVAVRQLTNEVLQREGNNRLLADPTLRQEVESRIIVSRGSVQELMDNNLRTQREQINEALSNSNEVQDEREFPDIGGESETEGSPEAIIDLGSPEPAQTKRNPGRPKKTQ